MKTTTYKCDRCGNSDITNTIKIERVGVFVGWYKKEYSSMDNGVTQVSLEKDWCLKCRTETGLIRKEKEDETKQVPITLEDMVREIAYDAACEAIQNR